MSPAGMLIGIAIRSGSPLSVNLAEPVWKQLAGMPLSIGDLTEMDKDFVPGMSVNMYQLYQALIKFFVRHTDFI